tara:strand:+ start:123029 stop:123199 length:171 start_codon:yes stop_codon:yes gene_type:complete
VISDQAGHSLNDQSLARQAAGRTELMIVLGGRFGDDRRFFLHVSFLHVLISLTPLP